ncbi:uncharacterized protein UTRI_01846_B [Ustilago trichophora]|uniref:C2H2-type domain-containing protein n=1 Tax=Ustilago trichophora TaxID=86804 RepID=A0A5C3DTR8_9BASI|nr:uncharacterized protein UTRI_01846_B [Ustilago trichophora]
MSFTFPSSGITSFGSPPSTDTYTKPIDSTTSDRIGELQKFLLGSDWSSLSSLSPPIASVRAVVDNSNLWPSSTADVPLFPSSVETVKPMMQSTPVASRVSMPEANVAATPAPNSAFVAPIATSSAVYQPALTPPHRQSFDTCYSDSVGSPDSERDFLTSPSLFDDADFEFDADNLSNFPLFGECAYGDAPEALIEDPVSAFASNLENVKLEADDQSSQLTESDLGASQSTVMPSQSQVKTEDDVYDSKSTLEAAFKTESDEDTTKLEPKHEQDMWSPEELKPYFSDDESKAAVFSTLANAFGQHLSQPIKQTFPASESNAHNNEQHTSQVGPIRSSRAPRDRRPSPSKVAAVSASASPAPIIDPVTNTKRWQCDECFKYFDRAYNLKTHRITHQPIETRERPYICFDERCGKQFARKHDMQRHFENVHRGESRRARGGSTKRSRADDLG